MNDFRFGGFKISVDREEKEVIKSKPKPKGLFSLNGSKKTTVSKEIKVTPKPVKSKVEKRVTTPKASKLEVKEEKPKSVYKTRSALKKKESTAAAVTKETKAPSFSFKLPSVPASLPKSTPKPDPVSSSPAIPDGAFVRPQSTYSARIASYFVFVIFLYFFFNF